MHNLKFAKIDATKNDVSGLLVEGYPSFYYYGIGENQRGVHYDGHYTADEMVKFLQVNMGEDYMVDEDHDHDGDEEIDPDL